jgi:hypothetical protein
MYPMHLRNPRYNTITIITGLGWHDGVRKGRFQQSDTTHSGTGKKETHNINVVGKNGTLASTKNSKA